MNDARQQPCRRVVGNRSGMANGTRTSRLALVVAFGIVLSVSGIPALDAQSTTKTDPGGLSFTPAQDQILLLFSQGDDAALDAALAGSAEGWSVFKDLQPAAGKPRTYVLLGDPAGHDVAQPDMFILPLAKYLATPAGNVLKVDARLELPHASDQKSALPAAVPTQSADPKWTFTGDAGLILFFIRPQTRPQFEGVLIRAAAAASADSVWTAFRVSTPTQNGQQIYALLISPVRPGVNYAFAPLLGSTHHGAELTQIYSDYATAVGSANLFDLKRVGAGKP